MRLRERKCSWQRFLNSKNGILDHQDTISRLPGGVIHHILSFLPSTDREKVRFLSRNWRLLYSQSQKKLSLTHLRLDEEQLPRLLVDDFPSIEYLSLRKCLGMKNLRLVNYKLKNVEFFYCGSLKKVDLKAPHLESFYFHGPRPKPCRIELGVSKHLRFVQLVGVDMSNGMFLDCNRTFPVLQQLTLSGCDMSGSIKISSGSLETLDLLRFNKPVDITIDAPKLNYFGYSGSMVVPVSYMNLPCLATASIVLNSGRNHKRDSLWFHRLIEMLQGLKAANALLFESNSEKNIIIPKELRGALVPPLYGVQEMVAMVKNSSSNCVDLADAMLWISPRVQYLTLSWRRSVKLMRLVHGEFADTIDHSCSFCTSHPSRCWRHSLIELRLMNNIDEHVKILASYFLDNLENAGRGLLEVMLN